MPNEASERNAMSDIKAVEERIQQLNDKSTQMLLFLSFALLAVATLVDKHQNEYFRQSMVWWGRAMYPVLVGVLPVKEGHTLLPSCITKDCWYKFIRVLKVFALLIAVAVSIGGAHRFVQGVYWAFAR